MNKSLDTYKAKRDFSKTPEPAGGRPKAKGSHSYVIQKHAARRLHYDFRLEMDGVLKSWAVPEGPSLVPNEKRLAVHVEDHPLEYGGFEGVIPKGEYGGGTVMVWDRGIWIPEIDPKVGYKKGHLKFRLEGEKLGGAWHLVRMARKPREKQEAWLLFKSKDEASRDADAPSIVEEMPLSVASGRDIDAIARDEDRVWSSKNGGEKKTKKKRLPALKLAKVAKAKKGALPDFIEPCLPTTVEKAPSGRDWVHEIKYDGYRIQIRIEGGKVALLTRQGLDWTSRFQSLAKAALALPLKSAILDGEVTVHSEAGIASFTSLVDALKAGAGNFIYYAFDLLHADGLDLRQAPLLKRKETLAKVLAAAEKPNRIIFSEHIDGDGDTIFRHSCRLGLEGIVSKKANAPYLSGRSKTWLKVRCAQRGEFVIAGFVPSSVDKHAVGALVLGEYDKETLVPSGHVGTGFTIESARELWKKLDPLRVQKPPLKDTTAEAKKAKWVEPQLVAEIEFRTRTGGGLIRHSSFKGLVEGKDPTEVKHPASPPAKKTAAPAPSFRLTNPSRLLWPSEGITKQGLAEFYTEIADWILPHIVGRPLSLVRCPGGIEEQCFFQKHKWAGLGNAAKLVPIPGDDEPMLAIEGLPGLLEFVQASVLEIHPWGSLVDHPELPDRIILDLDPGDDVPWDHMSEAALDVRERLEKFGLKSFVKTTGGKGLHIVVPITPKSNWATAKAFAQRIAEQMAADRPDRYVDNMAKKIRRGRIYVDYVRNGMGATAVAAYSTRARRGAAVSTPLAWEELGPGIRADHFTIENLPQRLAYLDRDPWEGFFSVRQDLSGEPEDDTRRTSSRGWRKRTRKKAAR